MSEPEPTGDQYEEYNYEKDKHVFSSHSGKGRSKREAGEHTNHSDPGGHTRKTTQKLMNNHEKQKSEPKADKEESKKGERS